MNLEEATRIAKEFMSVTGHGNAVVRKAGPTDNGFHFEYEDSISPLRGWTVGVSQGGQVTAFRAATFPPPPRTEICATCRFYVSGPSNNALSQSKEGHCRRREPVVTGYRESAHNPNATMIRPVFPPVNPQDWCGEYRSKEASE